ncbi:hypothetical protein MSAN_00133600 [Mycena sanguinolenta]|uniref:Uncharacterized protein n=1 Tax=Mycena sanguinolenta TaxID=230812 RepID=A0A8H6ZDQ1_9AGAR|nr:hypothetical protein MSAN_00133600 [Mycena sanguinolenta]
MEFRSHLLHPKYIETNATKFLDHEWIDIALLKEYLGHASVPLDAFSTRDSKHAPADQRYLDGVSARQLMDFRNHLFNPKYIEMNAAKFLDHQWINIKLLKEYLGNVSAPLSTSSNQDPIQVKVEAPIPTVKIEPHAVTRPRGADEIKLRTIAKNFYEILSDSESDTESDLEVIEALHRTSRSSSAVPLSSESGTGDLDSESEVIGSGVLNPLSSDDDHNEQSQDGGDDTDNSELVESDTLWMDDGISFMRIGDFCPTAKICVERMEYRTGPANGASRGQQHFVGCSGWTPKFSQNHRYHPIRDEVDENLLAKALAGQRLTDDSSKDTPPCSGIVHPHTGLKRKICPHAHIIDGEQKQGRIVNFPCDAVRYIYVPKDTSIRKALIIHNDTGHNHPIPPLTKMSYGLKVTYEECIQANGVLGATVSKIDNGTSLSLFELAAEIGTLAQSTRRLLDGKTPAVYAAPLHNKRIKRDILHAAKVEKYPNGLSIDALLPMFQAEITKLPENRYIHSYLKSDDGGIIIVTFVPYLLKLLDDPGVTSFDGDTTFKGIEGKLNEWEMTIFAKMVQRAASLLRAYVNRASTDFFELLFDELQRLKLMLTGKPIPFKKFVCGGNLLVANVDMDPAQVLGLCRSVMKYNDPDYSGIPNDTPPEEIAPLFIKICWRHAKEPVHDFRSLVTEEQFKRLMDFVYIDSKESLEEFSAFVYGLGIKKISDWWRHKEVNPWIIPCLVKSQSHIPAEVWDSTPSTTNTNEGQHHWTNTSTGIKLTPVEAVESRRKVDMDVAKEIKISLRTGILANGNNEMSHRMSRNTQRQSTTARKARERQSKAKSKGRKKSDDLTASSCGRVKAVPSRSRNVPAPPMPSEISTTAQVLTTPVTQPIYLDPSVPLHAPDAAEPNLFANFDFNCAALMDPLNFGASSTDDSFPIPNFEPSVFDSTMFDFSVDFSTTMGDHTFDFMNSFNPVGFPDNLDVLPGSLSTTSSAVLRETLPMLPPPPLETPPHSPPTTAEPAIIASSGPRCRRRPEVDLSNILTSTRTRAPTERKRNADETAFNRASKRQKQNKVWGLPCSKSQNLT